MRRLIESSPEVFKKTSQTTTFPNDNYYAAYNVFLHYWKSVFNAKGGKKALISRKKLPAIYIPRASISSLAGGSSANQHQGQQANVLAIPRDEQDTLVKVIAGLGAADDSDDEPVDGVADDHEEDVSVPIDRHVSQAIISGSKSAIVRPHKAGL